MLIPILTNITVELATEPIEQTFTAHDELTRPVGIKRELAVVFVDSDTSLTGRYTFHAARMVAPAEPFTHHLRSQDIVHLREMRDSINNLLQEIGDES